MGRVEGKVALITGAARGMGRGMALRLAEEGADIIAFDMCTDYDVLTYPMSTEEDLAETAQLVERRGRRVITQRVDTRNLEQLKVAVRSAVGQMGKLDIVCANAGIWGCQTWDGVTPELWTTLIGVNLTGTWHTCQATIPHLIGTEPGSLIITGSTSAVKGQPFHVAYAASKHGVVGVMRSLANELASKGVRVNCVHPTGVSTPMLAGGASLEELIAGDPHIGPIFANALPDVEVVEAIDVSNMVLYLASDEARYLTGGEYRVDAGNLNR
ncbi:3-ketoacyl-ACP reductase [Mycobacterium aquaticum]|uniref:3-ketoacyl-ACP reductase n=1 Tax=Mycobacterium aquaticum TaxID=1927124 RepID=A0A1X0A330_9MYCO|nr:3-ketoacyl-ACP reductase [Mycobacterium aquaticum]